MDTIPVISGIAGFVLIWSALKNKHPLDVIQFALQGKSLDGARPMFTPPPDGLGLTPPSQEYTQPGPDGGPGLANNPYVGGGI